MKLAIALTLMVLSWSDGSMVIMSAFFILLNVGSVVCTELITIGHTYIFV